MAVLASLLEKTGGVNAFNVFLDIAAVGIAVAVRVVSVFAVRRCLVIAFLKFLVQHRRVVQPDIVVGKLGWPLVSPFYTEKQNCAGDGRPLPFFVSGEIALFQFRPSEHDKHARGDEHHRVAGTDVKVHQAHRPCAGLGSHAQQHVGGKQRAEQHDLGGEEEPDAQLRVVQAGVRPWLNRIGDFHGG